MVSASDVPLFDELCEAVDASRLTTTDAAQLALALSEAGARGEEMETLDVAVRWFPNLEPLRAALAANPHRARHAFSLVGLILAERSVARSSTLPPQRPRGTEAR